MTRRITRREALKYSAATGALATGLTGVPRPAAAADTLKVGIVYVSPIAEIGWTKQHSLGAEAIANAFGERVEITAIDNIWDPQAGERVFRELASTGHGLIFGTSFSHSTPIQKAAPRFPDVAFEHCSGLKHFKNLGTFEAKYYEGTYLAGIAGGHVTKSKKLGFIGGFPIRTSWVRGTRCCSARRASTPRSRAASSSSTPGSTLRKRRRRRPPWSPRGATSSVP